jgi:hypothetical protein
MGKKHKIRDSDCLFISKLRQIEIFRKFFKYIFQKISIPIDRMSILPHKLAIIVGYTCSMLKFLGEISSRFICVCKLGTQDMQVTHEYNEYT